MKVLFTGASSFTGYWFVKTLVGAGHDVVAVLLGGVDRYEGVRQKRVEQLQKVCAIIPNAPFGSDAFLRIASDQGPWDLLAHHAADVTNYKSADFDVGRAVHNNTLNLRAVLAALKRVQIKGALLTGSVFESDEGLGNKPLVAFSPYGLSKALTWQLFRYYCHAARVPLGKFVIPNPFGPYEEERFTAFLMRTWKAGQAATVKTPAYVRDNIAVDLLAAAYTIYAERLIAGNAPIRMNPSGYVESQGSFASRVAREVRSRVGWPCDLVCLQQVDFVEPLTRINSEPAITLVPGWNEAAFWDDFVGYYR